MKLFWLSAVPFLGAGFVLMARRWRMLAAGLGLATMLLCVYWVLSLPLGQTVSFWGQSWGFNRSVQPWLLFMYGSTAILLVIAATTEGADLFSAPILVSVGLFSAVSLWRSWLSFLLMPAALAFPVLATYPSVSAAIRGASRYLAWVTLPIPFFLAISILLERFALFPDEISLANWSAWLVIPPIVLWLTLFPIHWTTPLWAKGNPPLTPAFLWTVKDWIVIYFFLALWQQRSVLYTEGTMAVLGFLGVLTTLFTGAEAILHSAPSALLGCAAMSALGIVVQVMAAGSGEALAWAVSALIHRAMAILLASSALAAMDNLTTQGNAAQERSFLWPALALLLIFAVGVLALVRIPLFLSSSAAQHMNALLQGKEPYLMQVWQISSAGIIIGLIRTVWQLWRDKARTSAKRISVPSFLVVIFLFLSWLWLELSPSLISGWVSAAVAPFLSL